MNLQQTQKLANVNALSCIYDRQMWVDSIRDPLLLAQMQVLLVRTALSFMSLRQQGQQLSVQPHIVSRLNRIQKYFQ